MSVTLGSDTALKYVGNIDASWLQGVGVLSKSGQCVRMWRRTVLLSLLNIQINFKVIIIF